MENRSFVVQRPAFFTIDQLENIEEAAFRILENVGIAVLDEEIQQQLLSSGFQADFASSDSPTAGIQEAIDALGENGGVVTIPPGEYLLRRSIRVHSNVTLQGAGEKTVLRKIAQIGSKLAAPVDAESRSVRVQDEANMNALLAGSSRELDTLLGAYAVLWGSTQNPFFSQRYKELILNLSDKEFFFSRLSVDPTVSNDFMTSYLWLREQGIFTEDEQKKIEAWMLKLKDAMQFPLQEANWGSLPQLAKALELHFPDEAKAIGKSIPRIRCQGVLGYGWNGIAKFCVDGRKKDSAF